MTRIDDFSRGVGKVAIRELKRAGYTRLEQFAGVSETELLKLHGVGPKALAVLREALAERGLAFASSSSEGAS